MKDLSFLLPLMAGCFGATLGSFLNVVIYRLPRESLSVNKPRRSCCPHCGTTIRWYENIPIISYLVLCGHCRTCHESISLRYPIVEGLTLLLFVIVTFLEMDGFLSGGPHSVQLFFVYLVHLVLVMIAIVVTFIDIDFKIIPDEINIPGMWAAPVLSAFLPLLHEQDRLFMALDPSLWSPAAALISALVGAAVGAGSLLLVGQLGKLLFKKDAMGFGDVKFMALVGGFLGWDACIAVFLLACLAGSVIGIGYKIVTKRQDIPFGPFLSLGMVVIILFREEVYHFTLTTWPSWIQSFMR